MLVVTADTIQSAVTTIWSSMLGMDAQPHPQANMSPPVFLTGCVQITGDWQGAVTLDCPSELAKRAAAIMFDIPASEVDSFQVHDALGELTNMIAGNFKSLLSERCDLSLPAVAQGSDYAFRILESKPINRVGFRCESHPFVVTVFKSSR
jgi:CheY-specific phosphatase CheX